MENDRFCVQWNVLLDSVHFGLLSHSFFVIFFMLFAFFLFFVDCSFDFPSYFDQFPPELYCPARSFTLPPDLLYHRSAAVRSAPIAIGLHQSTNHRHSATMLS